MKSLAIGNHNRQHAQAREEKAIEHHVLHAHLVHGEPAPVEAGTPQATGKRTSAVTEKCDFSADIWLRSHPSLMSHTEPEVSDQQAFSETMRKLARHKGVFSGQTRR